MPRFLAALTALGVVAACAAPPASAPDESLVRIDSGPVRGVVTDTGRTFTGIPYAQPPVGELRWREPRPPTPWTTPVDATQPAPLCAQQGDHLGTGSLAEDCLYLNVTSPRGRSPRGPRPVIVWLHGGSFKDGGGGLYPAQRLATRGDAVVVTVNYRLGALGFLAHPLLDDGRASGNFGLADQQAALRWVRDNAAAFGGDPRNVTLAGESAGAISVCAHLAAPSSAGLFHRAILQSGPCAAAGSGNDPRPRRTAEDQGQKLVASLGLGTHVTAARLRDPRLVTPEKLLSAAATTGAEFGPVVGAGLLPVAPERAIAAGRMNRVPVLHGINRDEQRLQVWGYELARYQGPVPADRYTAEIRQRFGGDATRVLRRYPLNRHGSASHALAAVLTDSQQAAATVETARLLSRRVPTYTYEFADDDAPWFRDFPEPYPMGAYHAAELPYLFDVGNTQPLDEAQQTLAGHMIDYWASFARTGVPAAPGAPAWTPGTPGRLSVQALDTGGNGIGVTDFAVRHQHDFWSTVKT